MLVPSPLPSKATWANRFLSLGLVVAASGCQFAFGDFEFVPEQAAGGAGGVSTDPCSTSGAKRCDPAVGQPQICKDGVWTNNGSRCSEPNLCNVGKGLCDACFSGIRRCASDNISIETCRAGGDGWDVEICPSAQVCDPDRLTCVACQRNRGSCSSDGNSIFKCLPDLSGFETVATSCAGLSCVVVDGRTDYCAGCDPQSTTDAPRCLNPGVLLTCDPSRQWLTSPCTGDSCVPASSTRQASCAASQ